MMARHLWAFCVALATAAQPQNATRQLDAYDPPPTDLSRACVVGVVRRVEITLRDERFDEGFGLSTTPA